jgi:uncharacterized membrane protein YagU involved in acid resistance
MRKSTFTAIFLGGFLAGTIDIGAAALINFVSPMVILHFIAGGLLGKAALTGDSRVALLGLVLQWAMSLVIATVYVAASRWLPIMRRLWIVGGLAYGAVIFFVMNYVVVPLSAWGKWPNFTAAKFAANLSAMLLFGLILALFARHAVSEAQWQGTEHAAH